MTQVYIVQLSITLGLYFHFVLSNVS